MIFLLAHDLHGLHGDSRRTEEQGLDFLVGFFVRRRLGVTRKRVAGVVDNHIDMVALSEMGRGSFERIVDGFGGGDI